MPNQPSRSEQYIDIPLSNVSIGWAQSQTEFVHNQVFAEVPVQRQSGKYPIYTKDYWFRTAAAKRAPATESMGTGYHVDYSPSYFCDRWGIHHDVPEEDRANAMPPLDVDDDASEFVTQQLWLKREQVFMRQYMTTGIWSGYSVGGNALDFAPNTAGKGYWDSGTSNPLMDVDNLKKSIKSTTGYRPNRMVVAENVYYALRNHPMILDRIKYGATPQNGAFIDEGDLARFFGVEKFLVAGAVLNTAQEGQTANTNFLINNTFLLCYAAPAPSLRRPSAGYIFTWNGLLGGAAFSQVVRKMPLPLKQADRIEVECAFQMAQVSKELGVLGTAVLANP